MPSSRNKIQAPDTPPRLKRAADSQLSQDTKRLKIERSSLFTTKPQSNGRHTLRPAKPHQETTARGSTKSNQDATIAGRSNNQPPRERAPPTMNSRQRAIQRQHDTSVDDQDYERLLRIRRNERTSGVDRYVPTTMPLTQIPPSLVTSNPPGPVNTTTSSPTPPVNRRARKAGFGNLTKGVQDRILSIALVRSQSIKFDFSWLTKNFIQLHSAIPQSHDTVTLDSVRHNIPRSTASVNADIQGMQARLTQGHNVQALLDHAREYSSRLAPTGLDTALLHISRDVHARAARIFYSRNIFHFPSPEAGFLTLEAFLITIGRTNTSHLRSLRVHAPLWHAGISSDAIEGAMLDALSPATRLAVLKPPGEDRLLSAIQTCTSITAEAGNLKSLELDLLYPKPARHFISHSLQVRTGLLRQEDAAAFVERKDIGVSLLKPASTKLATSPSSKPVVRVLSAGPVTKSVAREFRSVLAPIIREADKYGWGVDQILRDPANWKNE